MLRGAFLAEEYLKDMLATTYFGEKADVYLCMPDGRVIASSGDITSCENLLDSMVESGVIDSHTAEEAKNVFINGGEGTFICESGSKTDNICVMNLPDYEYVLVQTFPLAVTQSMIKAENLVGMQLEVMLIGLF